MIREDVTTVQECELLALRAWYMVASPKLTKVLEEDLDEFVNEKSRIYEPFDGDTFTLMLKLRAVNGCEVFEKTIVISRDEFGRQFIEY